MASIVIPWIMVAAIREEEKDCVHTHCMHRRNSAMHVL